MGFMQLHLALSYRQCFTMACSVRPDLPNSPQSDSFLLQVGYIVTAAAAVSLLWVQSWLFIKGYVHRRTSESPGQVLICLLTVNRTMTTVLRAVWIITVFRAHWKTGQVVHSSVLRRPVFKKCMFCLHLLHMRGFSVKIITKLPRCPSSPVRHQSSDHSPS